MKPGKRFAKTRFHHFFLNVEPFDVSSASVIIINSKRCLATFSCLSLHAPPAFPSWLSQHCRLDTITLHTTVSSYHHAVTFVWLHLGRLKLTLPCSHETCHFIAVFFQFAILLLSLCLYSIALIPDTNIYVNIYQDSKTQVFR